MSDRGGVEIDYCPRCRGVWLDRGELDKIIERSSCDIVQNDPTKHDSRYADRTKESQPQSYHHDTRYKKRNKDNFLSDLFDF